MDKKYALDFVWFAAFASWKTEFESVLTVLLCRLLGLAVPEGDPTPPALPTAPARRGSDCDMSDATVEVMREDSGELRVGRGEVSGEPPTPDPPPPAPPSRLLTLLLGLPLREECFCRTAIMASRSASCAA